MRSSPDPGMNRTPAIDARAKLIAAFGLIGVIALGAPPGLAEFLVAVLFVLVVTALLEGSLMTLIGRVLLVVPFAGTIALCAPLARLGAWSWAGVEEAYIQGWPLILAILAKSTLSVLIVTALVLTTRPPDLLRGLQALGLPDIFLTLFTFLLRFTDLFREQLSQLRAAVACRAPGLRGWRLLRLYGSLGGNLLVRAYERGEQVHGAMRARGYQGSLPAEAPPTWRWVDTAGVAIGLIFALALAVHP